MAFPNVKCLSCCFLFKKKRTFFLYNTKFVQTIKTIGCLRIFIWLKMSTPIPVISFCLTRHQHPACWKLNMNPEHSFEDRRWFFSDNMRGCPLEMAIHICLIPQWYIRVLPILRNSHCGWFFQPFQSLKFESSDVMFPHQIICNPKTYYLAWSLLAEWDLKETTIQMVTKIQSKKMKFKLGRLFKRVKKDEFPTINQN